MIQNKLYSEILQEFQLADTRDKKISVLRKYDHPRLRTFFELVYDNTVVFDTPVPEYRPAQEPVGLNWTYLHMEVAKLYRFIKDHPARSNTSEEKRKQLLLVILESLHKDEAELLLKLFKKDLGIKYLTPNILKEAYPGIQID